jgi:hypothetical protein
VPSEESSARSRSFVTPASEVVRGLRALGLEPVLVGGMALVVTGLQRIGFWIENLGD